MTEPIRDVDRIDVIGEIAGHLERHDHWLVVAGGNAVPEMLKKLSGPTARAGTYYADNGTATVTQFSDTATPAAAFLIGLSSFISPCAVVVALPKADVTFEAIRRIFELNPAPPPPDSSALAALTDVVVMCDGIGIAIWPTMLTDALLLVNPAAWQAVYDAAQEWQASRGE